MKLIATTLLCSSALLGFGETLESKASGGDVLTRTFTHTSESGLDSMSMLMNGEEHGGMGGDIEQESSYSSRMVVRDVLGDVEDGVVSSVERTYVELAGESEEHFVPPMGDPIDREATKASELQGKTVQLSVKDEGIVASWAENSEGEEELLLGLKLANDFDMLLPDETIELEGAWSIPASLFNLLADPIGDPHLVSEEAPEGQGTRYADLTVVEYEGDIAAEWVSIVEENGRKLARVEFQIEVTGTADMTETVEAMNDREAPEDAPEGMQVPEIESMDNETSYSGDGYYLWDLEGGHLHSLHISCETTQTESSLMFMSMGGQDIELERVSESTGSETWSVEYELQR